MNGIVLCDDMIFGSRITGTARALGLELKSDKSMADLQNLVRQAAPSCLIVDLANPGPRIEDLMSWLKENCTAMPRVVAYGSHVDAASLHQARAAGCAPVLPRSKFVEELPVKLPAWLCGDA